MSGHDTKSVCEKCTEPCCHEEVVCPECNGQGLFGAMPLGEEPDGYGLNLVEEFACRACASRGTVTAYCPHYVDRLVAA
jgi:hypothetical protein